MSFFEIQFPTDLSYGASGGPRFSTDIITVSSGYEQRNINWAKSRASYDVSHQVKTQVQLDELIAFFRNCKGKGIGFRFKDWTDYIVSTSNGRFVLLTATTFQMQKEYDVGGNTVLRSISKPVSGTISIVGGSGAVVDNLTGIVTVSSGTPTAWSGEFDVPCRFDTDEMQTSIDDFNVQSWNGIPIVEVRI